MKVTILLADAAQAVGGKLYILGGGWSQCGPGPTPSAVAVKIDVPWTDANESHSFLLELLTEDGSPVQPEGSDGPIRLEGQFEVGRPPGLPHGMPIDFSFAVNVPPLPLTPGSRYNWRLLIDGEGHEDWHVGFLCRPTLPPDAIQQ